MRWGLILDRVRRSVRAEVPFVVVLLIVVLGFSYVLATSGHWLRGVSVMAFGLVVASALRATLPAGKAGLLVVRGRLLDVICYLGLAVLVFGFAILLPQ